MRIHLLFLLPAVALTSCARPPAPAESPSPAEALDRMDERSPVPLLPMMALHQKENMRDHLVAVQEVVAALVAGDFEAVERAAARLGSSDQMRRMCDHMGAGAPGFTEQALGFHETADAILEGARERDGKKVLAALDATLRTCTACHARWKQKVVDDEEWERATAGKVAGHP